ncbi:MAG TPA: hypothetical protein VLE21_05395, partial [Candidatus Nitrosocosmicus sp.]|nr:hypothetical protein [Candidatus Nitrosocosmicus sp.]
GGHCLGGQELMSMRYFTPRLLDRPSSYHHRKPIMITTFAVKFLINKIGKVSWLYLLNMLLKMIDGPWLV